MISVSCYIFYFGSFEGDHFMNYSRQREAIISFLKARKDHPTAEVIYRHVREEYPHISLTTVYRNLSQLAARGEILRLSVGDGIDHYDYDTSPHNHFICKGCGAVLDLDMKSTDRINQLAAKNFDGIIEGHITYFYGLCPACKIEQESPDHHEKLAAAQ